MLAKVRAPVFGMNGYIIDIEADISTVFLHLTLSFGRYCGKRVQRGFVLPLKTAVTIFQ